MKLTICHEGQQAVIVLKETTMHDHVMDVERRKWKKCWAVRASTANDVCLEGLGLGLPKSRIISIPGSGLRLSIFFQNSSLFSAILL